MKLEFHHINLVSGDVAGLHDFYTRVLDLDAIPPERFPRTAARDGAGYDGQIRFATDGKVEFHLARRDPDVAFHNGQVINPVARGHIAFRTDDIAAVKAELDAQGIPYSDYGTAFAAEWHQIFFHDPEGTVIEVHQKLG